MRVALGFAVELAREHLAAGHVLKAVASGRSMWPTVRDGEVVEIRPASAESVVLGDVVLVEQGGALVLHRVVGRQGELLVTRGDARPFPDPLVAPQAVLGRLERRVWDPIAARASRVLGRPLSMGAAIYARFFAKPGGRS